MIVINIGHYIEGAMIAYLENNTSTPTNLDYLKINTDRITPDTKIVGLKYKNPEYLEYINCLKTNSSCESKYGYIPEEYIPNTDISRITGSSEIAKVGETKSNELVINEGIIDKIPERYWNSTSDKVTSKSPGTFYLTCSDESGFSDTNLTRINIKPSSIFKLIINKISEPQISSDGKKATWTVKVSRVWFASGTAKLMLEKNSVKDINGNGNEKIETSPIKISRK